jgi:glutathione-regulated potassium-efflux system protein KefB
MPMLLQITLLLAAALIIVPLGKRLGMASVLGYLLTGILLGPFAFNIITDQQQMTFLAQFGVIMLMFVLGLELRPQRLWQMRQAIFALGGLQMLLTGGVLMLLLWLLTPYSVVGSLVIGLALALSSTAFVLQLLEDRQQRKTFYAQQSFAILLFQDMAAMLLLALIPLLAGQDTAHHGIAYFMAVLASFSGLFLFSRYILRPLFRFVAKSGATELLTAVALLIVLGVVVLMDALGISTTLGAFLTGVLLADSEFRHELEASIQPFKGLLLGLFFITVGMAVQFNVLLEQPGLIIAGCVAFILIKVLCLTLLAYFKKQSFANSLRLGVALAQGGEFAFVVFHEAISAHMLSAAQVAPLTLMVILSMLMTPALFWLMDRWLEPRFAQQPAPAYDQLHQSSDQSTPPILIAGFGRVGQIVARIAHIHHLPFTAIDNNLDQVDFVRQYGGKVYYADASKPDTLLAAGLAHSQILVLAIDDVEDGMNVARHVRLHHPEVTILARARDRHHVYLLRELGIKFIWRETYLSALAMAHQLLLAVGHAAPQAQAEIQRFLDYDEQLLQRQQGIYADPQKLLESHRDMLQELHNLFENDEFVQKQSPGHSTTTSSASAVAKNAPDPSAGP